jgi:hypothetical protein
VGGIRSLAQDDNVSPEDLLKQAEQTIIDASAAVHQKKSWIVVAHDPEEYIEAKRQEMAQGITFRGVPTNMPGYDEMMDGFGNGRLHVFGAPTGCGKSLMNVNFSYTCAYGLKPGDRQCKVAVIDTGELMYWEDWFPRMLACASGVKTKSIQKNWFVNNRAEEEAVRRAMRQFQQNPILWYSMPDFDGPGIYALIRTLVKREGVDLVLFDNIKINPRWDGKETHNMIGDLAQYLKDAAVAFEIPVVAFIQLTSDGSITGRKKVGMARPHISMFAGGQRTLQNADIGGVMDWENHEDPANHNRILMIQKGRNDQVHYKDEHMLLLGDLRRARLTVVENRTITPVDRAGDPNKAVANRVIVPTAGLDPVDEAIVESETFDVTSQAVGLLTPPPPVIAPSGAMVAPVVAQPKSLGSFLRSAS